MSDASADAGSPYAVSKLAHHPAHIAAFRSGERLAPVQLHLMPQNRCNHDCHFCSYRLANWKNSVQFDDAEAIPWEILEPTLREARAMGTRAVELTGGGEPFLYPHIDQLIDLIDELGFDLGCVTNGTPVTWQRAQRLGAMQRWLWARVSIDAGSADTYCTVRGVAWTHWDRAWATVRNLSSERGARADRRVGVGFVVTRENYTEVAKCCRLAKTAGADNVRLSIRFGPGGNDYYLPGQLDIAEAQAEAAERELNEDGRFRVHNLIGERRGNQGAAFQDYEPCYTMRLLCVIGGDAKVYTCCTLAFNPAGEMGDLRKTTFRELWEGPAGEKFFEDFKVRERCRCVCLYERRNLAMLSIVAAPTPATPKEPGLHANFI